MGVILSRMFIYMRCLSVEIDALTNSVAATGVPSAGTLGLKSIVEMLSCAQHVTSKVISTLLFRKYRFSSVFAEVAIGSVILSASLCSIDQANVA